MSLQGTGMAKTESAMDEVHARVKTLAGQIDRQVQIVKQAKSEVAREEEILDSLSTRFDEWVNLHAKLSGDNGTIRASSIKG